MHAHSKVTAQDVRRFVATRWDGQYVTYRDHAHAGYPECWLTRLHGPTGPVVITGVTAEGALVDLTR